MEIKFKVWFEEDGLPILSVGKYHLLKEIEKTGSIREAAFNLGLPYKKAHIYIKLAEQRLGYPLVKRERGKGAQLTSQGKKLLQLYEEAVAEFQKKAKELEKKLFSPSNVEEEKGEKKTL